MSSLREFFNGQDESDGRRFRLPYFHDGAYFKPLFFSDRVRQWVGVDHNGDAISFHDVDDWSEVPRAPRAREGALWDILGDVATAKGVRVTYETWSDDQYFEPRFRDAGEKWVGIDWEGDVMIVDDQYEDGWKVWGEK